MLFLLALAENRLALGGISAAVEGGAMIAVDYVRAGLALVQIPRGLKGPVAKNWQRRETCITSVDQAARINGDNIGLAHVYCTPTPTCALDVDVHNDADVFLREHDVDLTTLLTADGAVGPRSGRPNRAKLFYRIGEALPTIQPEGSGLEFRCASREGLTVQDVLPPSVHPITHKPYEWVGDWRAIPEIPPPLLAVWQSLCTVRAKPKPVGTVIAGSELLEDLQSALAVLDSDDYHAWIRNGMALKTLGDVAYPLWIEYSGRSQKFDHADATRRWESFLPRATTYEAIFGAAQKAGWINPAKGRARAKAIEEPPDHVTEQLPDEVYAQSTVRAAARPSDSSTWPAPIDLAALAARDPEPPRFIVKDWLPAGYATLCAGHGGVGKSAIALHLAVCIALGVPFAGIAVERRRVLYLSCEDREGVLHWRLAHICGHIDVGIGELAGHLNILDLVGYDALLWAPDRNGAPYTAGYGELSNRMRTSGAEVLMVDGISDTFGGSEISRTDAKRFTNAMVGLIPPTTGAVLLVGHVAKPTAANAATSEGYSGSTGWHNAARARWYLYPETEQGDDDTKPVRTGRLALELQKSNLGPIDETIPWRWSEAAHMFLPEEPQSNFDRIQQQRNERRGVLLAMKACADSNIAIPAATTGRRTAFHVLSAQSVFADSMRSGRPAVRRFWVEMEHLRAIGQIKEDSIRRADRHMVVTLTLTTEGLRACGQC